MSQSLPATPQLSSFAYASTPLYSLPVSCFDSCFLEATTLLLAAAGSAAAQNRIQLA